MHTEKVLLVSMTSLLAVCVPSLARPQSDGMIIVPIEAARFVPSDPARPNGTQIAILRGDPATGPSAILMKLKKGGGSLHVHSADYQLVVIQGTMKHLREGQTEESAKPLEPGSYWFQPGGKAHRDLCLADECLLHIVWSGKRDGRLVTERAP